HMTENRSAGGSIPPLGTIRQILSQLQIVISGPRSEGRLSVRAAFPECSSGRLPADAAVCPRPVQSAQRVRSSDTISSSRAAYGCLEYLSLSLRLVPPVGRVPG